jgi:hypothetical protein
MSTAARFAIDAIVQRGNFGPDGCYPAVTCVRRRVNGEGVAAGSERCCRCICLTSRTIRARSVTALRCSIRWTMTQPQRRLTLKAMAVNPCPVILAIGIGSLLALVEHL